MCITKLMTGPRQVIKYIILNAEKKMLMFIILYYSTCPIQITTFFSLIKLLFFLNKDIGRCIKSGIQHIP